MLSGIFGDLAPDFGRLGKWSRGALQEKADRPPSPPPPPPMIEPWRLGVLPKPDSALTNGYLGMGGKEGAKTWRWGAKNSSKQGTEEFLFSEGVFRGWHRANERILAGVGIAVGHQVCSRFGHLYSAHAGLNLQLLHHFASLPDAHCAVDGGFALHGESL